MCSMQNACFDMRDKTLDYNAMRKNFALWKRVAPLMLCDYYPLTPYSAENNAWIGWQFDSPEKGEGMVEMFRRDECSYTAGEFKLRGLDTEAKYIFTDEDTGRRWVETGKELTENGLDISLPKVRTCILYTYKKAEN